MVPTICDIEIPCSISPELDFTSELFNAAKALTSESIALPYPKSKTYNNLAEYYLHTFGRKKCGTDSSQTSAKASRNVEYVLKRNYSWYYDTLGLDISTGFDDERCLTYTKKKRNKYGKSVNNTANIKEMPPDMLLPLRSEKIIVKRSDGTLKKCIILNDKVRTIAENEVKDFNKENTSRHNSDKKTECNILQKSDTLKRAESSIPAAFQVNKTVSKNVTLTTHLSNTKPNIKAVNKDSSTPLKILTDLIKPISCSIPGLRTMSNDLKMSDSYELQHNKSEINSLGVSIEIKDICLTNQKVINDVEIIKRNAVDTNSNIKDIVNTDVLESKHSAITETFAKTRTLAFNSKENALHVNHEKIQNNLDATSKTVRNSTSLSNQESIYKYSETAIKNKILNQDNKYQVRNEEYCGESKSLCSKFETSSVDDFTKINVNELQNSNSCISLTKGDLVRTSSTASINAIVSEKRDIKNSDLSYSNKCNSILERNEASKDSNVFPINDISFPSKSSKEEISAKEKALLDLARKARSKLHSLKTDNQNTKLQCETHTQLHMNSEDISDSAYKTDSSTVLKSNGLPEVKDKLLTNGKLINLNAKECNSVSELNANCMDFDKGNIIECRSSDTKGQDVFSTGNVLVPNRTILRQDIKSLPEHSVSNKYNECKNIKEQNVTLNICNKEVLTDTQKSIFNVSDDLHKSSENMHSGKSNICSVKNCNNDSKIIVSINLKLVDISSLSVEKENVPEISVLKDCNIASSQKEMLFLGQSNVNKWSGYKIPRKKRTLDENYKNNKSKRIG